MANFLKILLALVVIARNLNGQLTKNNPTKTCANKVSLWNGKIDYLIKICKNPTKSNMRVELRQISLNDSTSLTFPNATYQNIMEKREYKIEFFNIGQLNRSSFQGISKALKLYFDCYNNPFSSGCMPPTKGCTVSNITTSPSAVNGGMMQIVLEQDNNNMDLTCIQGNLKTQLSPSKPTRSRRSGNLFPCCPKDKNIICHGCTGVTNGGKVKVTVCPKGFKCLGKVSGGNGGNTFSNINTNMTNLTIIHHANKLLYRKRQHTERKNTVEDLINLDHLKVVHKAIGMLENGIPMIKNQE